MNVCENLLNCKTCLSEEEQKKVDSPEQNEPEVDVEDPAKEAAKEDEPPAGLLFGTAIQVKLAVCPIHLGCI